MVNAAEIAKCFDGLVGFFQPNDPSYPNIDIALTRSSSGKYIQTSHPLCSIENISNICPEFNTFLYPSYDSAEPYIFGSRVVYQDKIYQSLVYIPEGEGSIEPGSDSDAWAVIDPFSEWLKRIYQSSCDKVATELIKAKAIKNVGRSLVDSQRLYEGFGLLDDRIVKSGRFVGFEMTPSRIETMQIRLDQLGIQLDTDQVLNIYLYHSSKKQPLKVIPITILDAEDSFGWFDLQNVVLSYLSKINDATGRFFFGYYEDDLTGQAITRQMDISRPCYGCSSYNVNSFNIWNKHVKIRSFQVVSSALREDKSLFDTTKISYSTSSNFGLNLSLTVQCDMTSFFCRNKAIFSEALSMQICMDLLQEIAFDTRINAISDKVRSLAMAELDPKKDSGSFRAEYMQALKALNINFSGFDSTCLPCTTKGIKRGSI